MEKFSTRWVLTRLETKFGASFEQEGAKNEVDIPLRIEMNRTTSVPTTRGRALSVASRQVMGARCKRAEFEPCKSSQSSRPTKLVQPALLSLLQRLLLRWPSLCDYRCTSLSLLDRLLRRLELIHPCSA